MAATRLKLFRSRQDRLFVGVAGGLAKHFRVDPLWIRLAFLLLVPAGGVGVIAYLVLAVLLPPEDQREARPDQIALAGLCELGQRSRELTSRLAAEIRGKNCAKNTP